MMSTLFQHALLPLDADLIQHDVAALQRGNCWSFMRASHGFKWPLINQQCKNEDNDFVSHTKNRA
jgi:hypothetical protein